VRRIISRGEENYNHWTVNYRPTLHSEASRTVSYTRACLSPPCDVLTTGPAYHEVCGATQAPRSPQGFLSSSERGAQPDGLVQCVSVYSVRNIPHRLAYQERQCGTARLQISRGSCVVTNLGWQSARISGTSASIFYFESRIVKIMTGTEDLDCCQHRPRNARPAWFIYIHTHENMPQTGSLPVFGAVGWLATLLSSTPVLPLAGLLIPD
jgi:hypothetical protein